MFTPEGPAGIFALYLLPGTNKYRVLLNEFITVSISCTLLSSSFDDEGKGHFSWSYDMRMPRPN